MVALVASCSRSYVLVEHGLRLDVRQFFFFNRNHSVMPFFRYSLP
jgi:hypothetical protein